MPIGALIQRGATAPLHLAFWIRNPCHNTIKPLSRKLHFYPDTAELAPLLLHAQTCGLELRRTGKLWDRRIQQCLKALNEPPPGEGKPLVL